jgi:hypothetical protein
MTSIHGAIVALLVADTAVSTLVSNRIYPVRMPLNVTYPAISIHEISGNEDHVTGHKHNRYQVSCWSTSFSQVQSVKEAVIDCLQRYKGVASGNKIKQISFEGSMDLYEEETKIYHIPLDFIVIHYT